jgi:beta-lactamase class A
MNADQIYRFEKLMSLGQTRRSLIARSGIGVAAVAAGLKVSAAYAAQGDSATPSADDAGNWAAIDEQLQAVSPDVALLVAELKGDAIETVHGLNEELVLAVGSSFKLWILGALAKQVEAGLIDWEQEMEISDQYRSVPGGDLRYVPAGTKFTVRYLAERMIQKSDNTATDHVFHLVGRENVEAAMAEMGHHDPSLNTPIFATREMVMIKFAMTQEQRDAYFAASVEERRRLLNEDIAAMPYEAIPDLEQTAPIEIERVEWFANRVDLAKAMQWLLNQSQQPGMRPVTEIMSLETQLPFEGQTWPYVGFKGGSEMGVLSGTWLLQRADGRHFVFSIGFRDLNAEIDLQGAIGAMVAVQEQLAAIL